MDKRYQVFVSSTYADLTDERAQVIQAILNLSHLPAGMEMFPAADADQMTLIKEVIDESDYYVVVVAGRYGSVSAEGISYTEQEYDYAVETGVPILGFVHGDPDKIEQGKTDQNDDARKKLAEFRTKVETRMVRYFTSPAELGGHVTTSLVRAFKNTPRTGWVRGDQAMTVETEREIIGLREQLASASAERENAQRALVEDTSELAQGNDTVTIPLRITGRIWNETERGFQRLYLDTSPETTWDELFGDIGPVMIDEATEEAVRKRVMLHAWVLVDDEDEQKTAKWRDRDAEIFDDDWDLIRVQFRALGLIDKGQKKRPINDENKYLSLTDKGDRHLTFLRAQRKSDDEPSADADADSQPT